MWQGCLKACTKRQLGADEPGQPKGLELYMNGSYRSLDGLTTRQSQPGRLRHGGNKGL
jgi:hypothetical protein